MQTSIAEERSQAPHDPEIREPAPRTLALSVYDRNTIAAWVRGDPDAVAALLEDARLLAESLAGPDGAGGRRRLLSRSAATARAQERVLAELLARTVAARDFEGAKIINRVLETTTRRLVLLIKELAVEEALRSRPSILIAHANNVAVAARYP